MGGAPGAPSVKHRFFVTADQLHGDTVTFSPEQWHQLHLRAYTRVRKCSGNLALNAVQLPSGLIERNTRPEAGYYFEPWRSAPIHGDAHPACGQP